ncbi:toll/interleukin-1 receptor domain-containing protein [Xanthobacter sp.]|uniref:toll/interleukin-1 receptor domain-containing protein n=1 Tax=Xanthobacter sp. TaxID=35809 RepID=UPI00345B5A7F
MPIRQATLREYSARPAIRQTIAEARREATPTAFLSHSHKDAVLAKGVQSYFSQSGWNVYIDWEDGAMPDRPNRETADRIREKIRETDLFLFLATANSMASRWCPWELGYADGRKIDDSIFILQTSDSLGSTFGNEYIGLYRRIDEYSLGGVQVIDTYGISRPIRGKVRP